jgi:hypothetical protein
MHSKLQHDGYHVEYTFQGFTCTGKLGGTCKCNPININYDVKIVIPLLMACFDQLNPTINASSIRVVDDVGLDFEENTCLVWGGSIEESFQTLVIK